MIIHDFSNISGLLQDFLGELRDARLQKDSFRFRFNLERVGELLGYELSKTLNYVTKMVTTPLGEKKCSFMDESLVLGTILRAGFPLFQGISRMLEPKETAFIGAQRNHYDGSTEFRIDVGYIATSSIEGKTLILADPMLATGQSFLQSLKLLSAYGVPKQLHLVSVIGSMEGIENLQRQKLKNAHLWIASIDELLDENHYIIPGLGDAGDLAFGPKV